MLALTTSKDCWRSGKGQGQHKEFGAANIGIGKCVQVLIDQYFGKHAIHPITAKTYQSPLLLLIIFCPQNDHLADKRLSDEA